MNSLPLPVPQQPVAPLGKGSATKSDELSENSKRPSTLPPHFRKIILQILYDRHGGCGQRASRHDTADYSDPEVVKSEEPGQDDEHFLNSIWRRVAGAKG